MIHGISIINTFLLQDLKDSLAKEALGLESLRGELNALKRATQNTILVHNRSVGCRRSGLPIATRLVRSERVSCSSVGELSVCQLGRRVHPAPFVNGTYLNALHCRCIGVSLCHACIAASPAFHSEMIHTTSVPQWDTPAPEENRGFALPVSANGHAGSTFEEFLFARILRVIIFVLALETIRVWSL